MTELESRIHNEKVLFRSRQYGGYSTVFLLVCLILIAGVTAIQARNIALLVAGAPIGTISRVELDMIIVGLIGAGVFLVTSIVCRIMGEMELDRLID